MKEGARYVKIIDWSEADQCFVGSCPGLAATVRMKKRSLRSCVKLWMR